MGQRAKGAGAEDRLMLCALRQEELVCVCGACVCVCVFVSMDRLGVWGGCS